MKILSLFLILFLALPVAAKSTDYLPHALDNALTRLEKLKDDAELIAGIAKTDIWNGKLAQDTESDISGAYADARQSADAIIDAVIAQIDDLPEVITTSSFQSQIDELERELDAFGNTVLAAYRDGTASVPGTPEPVLAPAIVGAVARAAIGVASSAIVVWGFATDWVTDNRVKSFLKDRLVAAKWQPWEDIAIDPNNQGRSAQ